MSIFKRLMAVASTACAIIVVSGAVPASAQGTADERSACMGDALNFCSAMIPDVDKITVCLKENVSRLTPACQVEFQPSGRTRLRPVHFQK